MARSASDLVLVLVMGLGPVSALALAMVQGEWAWESEPVALVALDCHSRSYRCIS